MSLRNNISWGEFFFFLSKKSEMRDKFCLSEVSILAMQFFIICFMKNYISIRKNVNSALQIFIISLIF